MALQATTGSPSLAPPRSDSGFLTTAGAVMRYARLSYQWPRCLTFVFRRGRALHLAAQGYGVVKRLGTMHGWCTVRAIDFVPSCLIEMI